MLAVITALATAMVGVATVAFAGLQSREMARQTRINTSVGKKEAADQFIVGIREVLGYLVEKPELRPYFYDGEARPAERELHAQVLTVAEMFADVFEAGLEGVAFLGEESQGVRVDYCRDVLDNSPLLADLVRRYPTWWPQVALLLPSE